MRWKWTGCIWYQPGKECYFVLTKPTGHIIDYAHELEIAIS